MKKSFKGAVSAIMAAGAVRMFGVRRAIKGGFVAGLVTLGVYFARRSVVGFKWRSRWGCHADHQTFCRLYLQCIDCQRCNDHRPDVCLNCLRKIRRLHRMPDSKIAQKQGQPKEPTTSERICAMRLLNKIYWKLV